MSKNNPYTVNRFRSALGVFLTGRAAQGAANLVLTLCLIRLLEPGDFGAYMALWGMAEMLVPLSSFGLLDAVRRFLPELASRGSRQGVRIFAKWTTLARTYFVLFLCAGIWLIWEEIAAWLGFSPSQAEHVWQAVLLAGLIVIFRYACEMLECLLEQRWSQLARALHPVGRLAGIAVLFGAGSLSLGAILWVDVAVSLICLLLVEGALVAKVTKLPSTGDYRVPPRVVAKFAWHMAGVNLLQSTANNGTLRILVVRFLGLEVGGLFAFLQQMLAILARYLPAQLLTNIIRPILISRLSSGEPGAVHNILSLMWKSNLVIVLSFVALMAVGGDTIVSVLSGWRFNDAGLPALILCVGLGAASQGKIVNMAMQLHDKTNELRLQSFLFLLMPLAVWGGSQYGLVGVIVGIVLVQWFRNTVSIWWMHQQGIELKLDVPGIMRVLVLCIFSAVVGSWLSHVSGPIVALATTAGLLVSGILLARPLSESDQVLFSRVFKRQACFLTPLVKKANRPPND